MYFIFISCLLRVAASDLFLRTSTGPIQGVTLSSGIEAFLGIPYAESPVGELRFAKPVPKKTWTKTLDASKFSPPCPQVQFDFQYEFLPDLANMAEDCLYLNIWMPRFDSNETLKPVIIYIHHGNYVSGSSSMHAHDGENLAKRGNIVVVTFNYRLGPLGYLLAYVDEAEGNMGMYDQVLIIKWIRDNAALFGGDPKNIVLMGVSAGGSSVLAHIVSPISKALFQKAIVESGYITLNYFFDNNTRVFQNSEKIASMTGCSNRTVTLRNDPHVVVDCLKSLPVESLIRAEKILLKIFPLLFLPATGEAFLPRTAVDYLREGKFRRDVPILIGFNINEGTLLLTFAMPEYFGPYGENEFQILGKGQAMAFARGALLLTGLPNQQMYSNYYLRLVKNTSSQGYVRTIADMIGDYIISCNTLFAADFFSLRGNSVYFYVFGFKPESGPTAGWMGTTHLDELQYIFGNPSNQNFTDKEVEISNRFIERWSNFARTGDPSIPGQVPWLRYNYKIPLYLNIAEEESIRVKPINRCDIWRKPFRSVIDSNLIKYMENLD